MNLIRRAQRTFWRVTTLAALLMGLWAYHVVTSGSGEEGEARIEIPKGTQAPEVIKRLHLEGLAPYPQVTYWVLRYHGTFSAIQAGVHVLPRGASPLELASLLRQPPAQPEVTLTLIPGETIWHAANRIQAAGLGTRAAVLERAADRRWVRSLGLTVGPERPARADGVQATYLEGFLTPETHFFEPDASVEHVIETLTAKFKRVWERVLSRRKSDLMIFKEQLGIGPSELLILASLVEREAKVKAEAATIAGVFVNRLRQGMRLQTDPTLIYHPKRIGMVPTPTHRKDASNPYNTYAHKGLPPGPICSPTRHTIEATLAPARHNFLYFCARRDGTGRHAFARTLEEHEANVERYLKRR